MRRLAAWTGGAIVGVVGVGALVGRASRGRALLRRTGDRIGREARHRAGQLRGIVYRARGRRPDPSVTDGVLADRIRSTLGPLEARLDLPHVHVMAIGHVALLHGDVATDDEAEEIEAAVADVSGVEGVESYLHVGLLPGDTRPSEGARHQPPSAALRRLLDALGAAGVDDAHAPTVLRSVLSAFLDRLPDDERDQVTTHLPTDVRRLAAVPRRLGGATRPPRTTDDLVARVVAIDGIAAESAEPAITAVLGALRALVPEEAADVGAVLPRDLARLWKEASPP